MNRQFTVNENDIQSPVRRNTLAIDLLKGATHAREVYARGFRSFNPEEVKNLLSLAQEIETKVGKMIFSSSSLANHAVALTLLDEATEAFEAVYRITSENEDNLSLTAEQKAVIRFLGYYSPGYSSTQGLDPISIAREMELTYGEEEWGREINSEEIKRVVEPLMPGRCEYPLIEWHEPVPHVVFNLRLTDKGMELWKRVERENEEWPE